MDRNSDRALGFPFHELSRLSSAYLTDNDEPLVLSLAEVKQSESRMFVENEELNLILNSKLTSQKKKLYGMVGTPFMIRHCQPTKALVY